MRSCYKSAWKFPETGTRVIKGRYFFNDAAPHYDGESYFGSRNWTTHETELTADFGEQTGPQTWLDGSFPVRKPDPIVIGTAACIDGEDVSHPPERGLPWAIAPWGPWVNYLPQDFEVPPDHVPVAGEQFWLVLKGPFATHQEGEDYLFHHFFPSICLTADELPQSWGIISYKTPAAGHYALSYIVPSLGCANIPWSCDCLYGLPRQCWTDPPFAFCAGGGQKQSGAASINAFTILGSGGEKEDGAASTEGHFEMAAIGGAKEDGAADGSAHFEMAAAGGAKEDGAATIAGGFAFEGSGGAKEDGAAGEIVHYEMTGSGGAKQDGAATFSASGILYAQSSHAYTTCDYSGATNKDLGPTVGSGTTSINSLITSYAVKLVYKINFVGHTGTFLASINCTAIVQGVFRFRVDILDSSCAVVASGAYSADFTTTGVKTVSGSITWPAGGATVALRIEFAKTGGVGGNMTVTQDGNSFVTVSL